MKIRVEWDTVNIKLSLDEVDTLLRIVNMARADIFAYPNTRESIDRVSKSLKTGKRSS